MSHCNTLTLGSGPNALVLACYLARSGVKVVVQEKNSVAGGGLATVGWPDGSGFLHNTHSFFHRAVTAMPWYRDLELERQRRELHRAGSECGDDHAG